MKLVFKKPPLPSTPKNAIKRGKGRPAISVQSVLQYRAVEQMTLHDARKSARDIGKVPMVADVDRRDSTRLSFRLFCEIYFPEQFRLAWSPDHLKVIAKIENAVLNGGLFTMAMPRGSGKTTMVECAALWAILHGHRRFVVVIGATNVHATEILESLKTELETNEALCQDFPETVWPIQALEGIAHRCNGQLCEGERTYIGWTAEELILPTVTPSQWQADSSHEGYLNKDKTSRSSGAIIRVAGITGRIRGMKFKKPSGESTRPDFVILDDPQTDESAKSLSQSQEREATIAGAVLGLAGPGKKIAGVMPCTVIRPGDMADRLLDTTKHPQWNGERTKMVYKWPANEKMWEEYARVRATDLRETGKFDKATEFYRENQAEMDREAVIAWPERFNPDELSAIQHAWNLRLNNEAAFFAEYQNEPLSDTITADDDLTVDLVTSRLSGLDRNFIDPNANRITAFIDIQQKALWWMVCAWSTTCDGWVLDYGTTPDQNRSYYTLRDIKTTLADITPNAGLEGQLFNGIDLTVKNLLNRRYRHPSGAEMPIEMVLIDANWEQSTGVVYDYCRQSKHSAILRPSHGKYVGASTRPMAEWNKEPGERVGTGWRIAIAKRGLRAVSFDANYWKTFIATRLLTAPGDKGSLRLWGKQPENHKVLGDHCTAEHRVRTTGRGRTVDEWKLKPGRDNHYWDGLIGSAVGASILGMSDIPNGPLKGEKGAANGVIRKKFSDVQRDAQAKRK